MSHFIFQRLNNEGVPTGESVSCKTAAGIILQCPHTMDASDIRHLCDLAYESPNYPVDIVLWTGPEDMQLMAWQARISWFNGDTGEHRVLVQAE